MWVAQYYLALAKNKKGLEPVLKWINWVKDRATGSGILAEQFDAFTGEHLSAAPLTWSHAEYVITVISYLKKLEQIEKESNK